MFMNYLLGLWNIIGQIYDNENGHGWFLICNSVAYEWKRKEKTL